MITKSKVACFSGHRKLPQNCTQLTADLEASIVSLIERGVVFFGAGGALGFDMLAEETVLRLKERYPHIKLILVLPCPPEQQTLKWNLEQRRRYFDILNKADKVRVLADTYTNSCMLDRNRHLVDNSGHLICYLRENRGGTHFTVCYAEQKRLDIIRI